MESQLGEGSNFYFSIMLEEGGNQIREKKQQETLSKEDETEFTGKQVLLVEDNKLNAEIAHTILEMHGFHVEEAENGKIAVERFEASVTGYYDLILMDIRMPVMDGLEAAKTIRNMEREDARTVPIIAMTANAFDEDEKKSIESGMNGHLAKPIDVHALFQMLRSVL